MQVNRHVVATQSAAHIYAKIQKNDRAREVFISSGGVVCSHPLDGASERSDEYFLARGVGVYVTKATKEQIAEDILETQALLGVQIRKGNK